MPASVDAEQGHVRFPPSLRGLQDVNLGADLHQCVEQTTGLSLPFWVENDANGAGLAESYFGAACGVRDFVTVLLCTGVGGALMLDGVLHRGHTSMAGEIGHITIFPNGEQCPCGSRGCLETRASGKALIQAARESNASLANKVDLHYADLIAAAKAGDEQILGIFRSMGQCLGIGIASIVNVINPAKVIISGSVAKGSEFFMPSVEEELRNREFAGMDCKVLVSELLEDAEIRAALSTFLYYQLQD